MRLRPKHLPARPAQRRVAALAAGLCALAAPWLLAACEAGSGDASAFQEEVRRFRATHRMCNERHYQIPCQIGPDGRLYEYLPGERDRP